MHTSISSSHAVLTSTRAILRGDLDGLFESIGAFFYVVEGSNRIITGSSCNPPKRVRDAYVKPLGDVSVVLYPMRGDDLERALQAHARGEKWSDTVRQYQVSAEKALQRQLAGYFEACDLCNNEVFVDCFLDEVMSQIEVSEGKLAIIDAWERISLKGKKALRQKAYDLPVNALEQAEYERICVVYAEIISELMQYAKFN